MEELNFIKDAFNIEIINFPEMDIKNDLESLAALISNLDCVISVSSFASAIAPALGVNTKMLLHDSWLFLGEKGSDDFPWFSNVELYVSPSIEIPLNRLLDSINI